jgi:hypothetical protein
MAEERVVRAGDVLYARLYRLWQENDRPLWVYDRGVRYLVVRDNGEVYFVVAGDEVSLGGTKSLS